MKLKPFVFVKNTIFSFAALIAFAGCSSAPKRPMLVTDSYNLAYSRLELANNELTAARMDNARNHLTESYNLALSIDNRPLLCKICLSGVIFKLCQEKTGYEPDKNGSVQSFLDNSKELILREAELYASMSPESSKMQDLCRIYSVRISLSSGANSASLMEELNSCEKSVQKEPYYKGFWFRTKGDVLVAEEKYLQAASSYEEAAQVHSKNRYLWETGLDWYSAARAYSLAGNKKSAVDAIENALKYDRDAENTMAITLDYQAYSKILLKNNPTEQEYKKAMELEAWASRIEKTVQ